jgi:Tfp pilus assembly protein PilN
MTSLSTTILIITGFLVIFILLCVIVAAQHDEFSRRIDALASSQLKTINVLESLGKNFQDLSVSQIDLTESFKSLINDFQELVQEHESLREKYEVINKAQQHQARTNLQKQLLTLVDGNKETATQLIELEKIANPGRSGASSNGTKN